MMLTIGDDLDINLMLKRLFAGSAVKVSIVSCAWRWLKRIKPSSCC